jgi:predicted RNase H-related nuclease YkuK (DUF458 family)
MNPSKIAVMLDGGLGRVLCAIPALQELAKTCELIVVSGGWVSAYKGSGLKVIPMSLPNQAELLEEFVIIKPEPYWELAYRKGTANLVGAFYLALGIDMPLNKPFLPFATDTRGVGIKIISPKPVLMFQPHGSGGGVDARSMTDEEIEKVVNKYKKEYSIFLIGCDADLKLSTEDVTVIKDITEPAFIRYIQACKIFVGCDSAGLHIASASKIPVVAYLSITSGIKYYKTTSKVIRKGYEDMRINPRL